MPDPVTLNRSVTRGDYENNSPRSGGVFHLMLPGGTVYPDLPAYWSQSRDFVLASSVDREAMWASAIAIAVTKMSSLAWDVSGDVGLRVRRAQELLQSADHNQSWTAFLSKHLQDYLTTDNGAFIEVVRATRAPGSRILGLMHLDSCRVVRTGDPDIPAVYRDLQGAEHEMKAHQIIMLSDMPSARAAWFGIGRCAASRAWPQILKLEAIERYVHEKVSGRRPLAFHLVNGLNDKQLKDAVATADAQRNAQGVLSYMGAVVIATLGDEPKSLVTIPLAELPDGFDATQERRNAQLIYADAIGLDPQDLNPDLLASRALGTGAQSQVIDDKAGGRGLASWRQQFTHALNQHVLDDVTTFTFTERDYRDQLQAASVSQARADFVAKLTSGPTPVITPEQGLQILVDQDELPKEFLPVDQTPDDSLSDTEKPDSEEGAPPPTTEKAASDAVLLMAQEIRAAVVAYERANGLE